ncbi:MULTISPECIES: aminoglycoside N(3)-acetyltransferase [unclassified Sporolactobacillus]|uniref:aminoglycoside N(3)-acetyltransferase n=1 Tax=unclassified Sporolactobacillus TaxID=2628533 RepID=UPI0023674549|nr:AAC(3) family N-acetyltransferase [Sporolactobacillus sp. CQH2019]MDD9150010.1 AAC(3) family N-acetyltransferase [Sporolactobacillus sp. CQH2019]
MTEQDAIRKTRRAVTRSALVEDFHRLGLKKTMTVIVHTSMSRIGWVCGGPVTVIEALQEVLTAEGTLVMPAHSADVSDPSDWDNPAVPASWWQSIYAEMPPFDPERTPTLGMGRVAECFRTFPGVKRSSHPIYSFAAWGAGASAIISEHALDDGLGPASPLGKIYDRNGFVLLLGVGYGNNTSMHLGECLAGRLRMIRRSSPVLIHDEKQWVTYRDWNYHEERFSRIGKAFEKSAGSKALQSGMIGQAKSMLMSQRAIVDFTFETIRKG